MSESTLVIESRLQTARRAGQGEASISRAALRLVLGLVVTALALTLTAGARAQDASSGDQPRVLLLPTESVPARIRSALTAVLSTRAELLPTREYILEARSRRLGPTSPRALRTLAPEQGAALIVVASYGGQYRRRTLRVRYYDGSSGERLVSNVHVMEGQFLRPAVQHAILRDLTRAMGGERSSGGEGPEEDDEPGSSGDEPPAFDDWSSPPPDGEPAPVEGAEGEGEPAEEGEEGLTREGQFGFIIAAGFGFGHRTSSVPLMAGRATLATTPFPAVQGEILAYVRPELDGLLRFSFGIRYTTSIGVIGEDQRTDGPARRTDLRAHQLAIGLGARVPLAPGRHPVHLLLELGWAFRMFDSEIPITIPSYTLGGIYGRVGLLFPIADGPLSIGVSGELGHAGSYSEEFSDMARVSDGAIVALEATIRVELFEGLRAEILYREAHAFIDSEWGNALNDAERFALLRAAYLF